PAPKRGSSRGAKRRGISSLRADIPRFRHPGPALQLSLHEARELLGRVGRGTQTHTLEPLAGGGGAERLHGVGAQAYDDLARRAGRREQPEPGVDVEIGNTL